MAVDHVRDYWGVQPYPPEDLSQASIGLFLTRWVTHFCAPVFLFLAGTSTWLSAARRETALGETSRFLLIRGLWLIFLEVTVVSFSWQFGYGVTFLQVIWAIGVSMIVLAGLIHLPRALIWAFAVILIVGHNAFDVIAIDQASQWSPQGQDSLTFGDMIYRTLRVSWLWFVNPPAGPPTGWVGVVFAYPVVPWPGVMALGYAMAPWLAGIGRGTGWRVVGIGLGLVAVFFLLRLSNLYGDPTSWQVQERGWLFTAASVLNTTKYPPSLLFLLMTLGPALAIMPLLERWTGRLADIVRVFGRVPFFFYLVHLPLIHGFAVVVQLWLYGDAIWNPFAGPPPEGYDGALWKTWAVGLLTAVVLYWPCVWFGELKRRSTNPLLRYL